MCWNERMNASRWMRLPVQVPYFYIRKFFALLFGVLFSLRFPLRFFFCFCCLRVCLLAIRFFHAISILFAVVLFFPILTQQKKKIYVRNFFFEFVVASFRVRQSWDEMNDGTQHWKMECFIHKMVLKSQVTILNVIACALWFVSPVSIWHFSHIIRCQMPGNPSQC